MNPPAAAIESLVAVGASTMVVRLPAGRDGLRSRLAGAASDAGRAGGSTIDLPVHARPRVQTMLYKFKSKAAGDVIMLGPNGDQVMRLVGREPAAQGIFEVAHMPQLIAALERAVAADDDADAPAKGDGVSLRQRVWPLVEMLRRCLSANEVITWGA
jgi:hypothetical protein